MTDDTPHRDDQGKGRSDGSISRRSLMTGTIMTGTTLAASGVTPASLISSAAAQTAGVKPPTSSC
jgi:hypothetical protein